MKLKNVKSTFAELFNNRTVRIAGFTGVFGLAGVVYIALSDAAQPSIVFETETSTVSGNAEIITDSTASGGSAVTFGVNTQQPPSNSVKPTEKLPFDMPSSEILQSSNKKVFAHYMTAWPLYDNFACLMTPSCENSRYEVYGGYLRDKPLTKSSRSQKTDIKVEIKQAMNAGLDGFMLNISSFRTDLDHWQIVLDTLAGIEESGANFKIILMPDMVTLSGNTPTQIADQLAKVIKSPALYRLKDGRIVISPFAAERKTDSYWREFISVMQNKHNTKVAFIPTYSIGGRHLIKTSAPYSYAITNFGSKSPIETFQSNAKAMSDDTRSFGRLWMQPVNVQDYRARNAFFYEAANTGLLRASWEAAINTADLIQFVTWNDYGENSNMAPSDANNFNVLDISSYYLVKFKTGAYPTVKRDTLYLTHRTQPYAANATGPMTGNAKIKSTNRGVSIPPQDKIEVMSFLTSPAKIQIKANGAIIGTCDAKAGVDVCTVDLRTGVITAEAIRNSSTVSKVQSPYTIVNAQYTQDVRYKFTGSRR